MKKIFTLVLSVFPAVASADYLDDKIAELTKQKLEKIAELEECQKSTNGLKIAGITTLGVSTIGIAANIGEAVTLKNLDKDISTAEASKQDLDKQIQAQKAKNAAEQQAANNTCGVQTCAEDKKSAELSKLNAKDAVCVDGVWQASQCKDGFSGTAATCTLNAKLVTYYTNCMQSQGGDKEGVAEASKQYKFCTEAETQKINGAKRSWYNSNGECVAYSCKDKWFLVAENRTSKGYCIDRCPEHQRVKWEKRDTMACDSAKSQEEKPCPERDDEWKKQNHAEQGECDKTTGENYITQCKDGYDPVKDANGKIENCKYHCWGLRWAKSDTGHFCGMCMSYNGWLDVEVLGGVLNFDELKQYFDEKYSVDEYIDSGSLEREIHCHNGRYCYYADSGSEACFDTLQKLKDHDFENACFSPKYTITEHIIDYSIDQTLDSLIKIQAKVNGERITRVGRNKEKLVQDLEKALRGMGYTDFELVEKK